MIVWQKLDNFIMILGQLVYLYCSDFSAACSTFRRLCVCVGFRCSFERIGQPEECRVFFYNVQMYCHFRYILYLLKCLYYTYSEWYFILLMSVDFFEDNNGYFYTLSLYHPNTVDFKFSVLFINSWFDFIVLFSSISRELLHKRSFM